MTVETESQDKQKLVWSKPELETCQLEQTQGSPGSGTDGATFPST